jgi:phosphoserine phosphatase
VTHVAVMISDPQGTSIKRGLLRDAKDLLPFGRRYRWLSEDFAAEIPFTLDLADEEYTADAIDSCAENLRDIFAGEPVDIAILPDDDQRKRLLVADMDSTIIGQECIDELADLVGLKDHVAAITERAMRGEIDFEPALRERVALLKGIGVATIERLIKERITINPGARTLVRTMRANGAYTALVSGGFSLFTRAIAQLVGFDEDRSNELLLDGDRLSGCVREPILGRQAKRETLVVLAERLSVRLADTIAVGDGANDLAMLERAGLGVAYRAKPAVAAAADVSIAHGDLTALLFLQGYSDADFVG